MKAFISKQSARLGFAKTVAILAAICCVVTLCSFKAAYDDYRSEKPVQTSSQIVKQKHTMMKTSAREAVARVDEKNLMAIKEKKEQEKKIKEIARQRAEEAKKAAEKKKVLAAKKKAAEEKKAAAEKAAAENTKKTAGANSVEWNGRCLSKAAGSITGPSGRETYYNLDMSGVVSIMRSAGFSEAEYPYAVRGDGVKTLGGYVMVAANYGIRPRGSFVQTSLGTGIVCDTGGFASRNPTQLDIAVTW